MLLRYFEFLRSFVHQHLPAVRAAFDRATYRDGADSDVELVCLTAVYLAKRDARAK
ncbi:hypothetical protein [Limnoglobus roseus]|uniref:hypothetical protein n=1 Tax=Limnoglobus roseus TaxID=2598579 RepID=UPI00143D119D|nr:hypothetical protein [Limnoglobus roseus]